MIPIKTAKDMEQMRVACDAASEILALIRDYIEPGVSTGDVDRYAGELMAERECRSAFLGYKGFPGQICISINDEVVHGIGGDRRIQPGDIVKVDVGVIKNGWVGDNATTIPAGGISPEVTRLLQVTETALFKGIAKALAGNRLREVSRAIEDYVVAHNMSVVKRYVGHGVGRKLHEEPQVPNYVVRGSSPRLKPGMVLAIEPMVNAGREGTKELNDGWTVVTVDGKHSAHFEHSILVTRHLPEILTFREKPRFAASGEIEEKLFEKNAEKCLPG